MSTTTATSVAYTGDRAASAPLTWGQRAIGIALAAVAEAGRPAALNIRRVIDVPPGRALDEVLASLARLLERHEVLRSTFRDSTGALCQTVHQSGTLDVRLASAGTATARHRAAELADELVAAPFQPDRLHPLRCGIVLVNEVPAHLALVVSHQAVDAIGLRLLLNDLAGLLASGPPPGPARRHGRQPLDVAEAERTSTAATSRAALAAWRDALQAAPRSIFDYPRRPVTGDRYTRLDIRSPAIACAATVLADRYRVTTSAVLLTAHALLLSAYTGHTTVPMGLVAANRQHANLRDLVAATSQGGPFVLDVEGTAFDQAVRRTLRSSLRTYAMTYYDEDAQAALLLELRHEQGRFADLQALHNDARGTDQSWPGAPTGECTAAAMAALTEQTTITEEPSYTHHDLKWFQEVVSDPDAFVGSLHIDQAYVPTADGQLLLRGVEALLAHALFNDVRCGDVAAIAGIEPLRRPAGWVRVGRDWVDTAAVRELIAAAAGTRQVAVAQDAASGLTAYLGPDAVVASMDELHRAVCARITADTPQLLAPARYVLCARAPAAPDDIGGWRGMPVGQAGSGRTAQDGSTGSLGKA